MKKKLQKKKGFTLMEMLIVIAIIAILIAIAIPTFSNALEEAQVRTDTANARSWFAELTVAYMLDESTDATETAAAKITRIIGANPYSYGIQRDGGSITAAANGTNDGIVVTYTVDGTTIATFPETTVASPTDP